MKGRAGHAGLVTSATLAAAAKRLAKRDRDLARILAADGPPPLWARRPGFATLLRIILEQQVSLASAKAVYLRVRRGLGRVTPAGVSGETARGMLTAVTGIGRWTADIYLLMAMGRPDVWPMGDIALAKAAQAVKGLQARPGQESLARMAAAWRPYRSVAARMLWQHSLKHGLGRISRPPASGR